MKTARFKLEKRRLCDGIGWEEKNKRFYTLWIREICVSRIART